MFSLLALGHACGKKCCQMVLHLVRGGVMGASTGATVLTAVGVRLRLSGRGQCCSSRMPYGHFDALPAHLRMYSS